IPLSNFWVTGIVIIVYLVLINLKNFFLRPYIMGRSVHMNEALVFISILIATILQGILGALLVVPVLASVVVIGDYLRRRLAGLPPFEDDGTRRFVAPAEKIHPPRRKWTRKERRERLSGASPALEPESAETIQNAPAPDVTELPDSVPPLIAATKTGPLPARKKNRK
ncbi:MAG TPA: AI-2E family transporter, partial [Anaerolineales bacterium]|nr:AI-2E family transporter [Anaerolineales bacterium]